MIKCVYIYIDMLSANYECIISPTSFPKRRAPGSFCECLSGRKMDQSTCPILMVSSHQLNIPFSKIVINGDLMGIDGD